MTTNDRKMIPLPTTLVVRLDKLRGALSRPSFIEALLDEYDGKPPGARVKTRGKAAESSATSARSTPAARMTRAQATRAARPDARSSCPHPSSRKIGTDCALCGATGVHTGKR